MKSSLIKQISLITITAFLFVVGVGGVAWHKFKLVVANQEQIAITTTALRHHFEADMMHDALRSDVITALHAAAQKNGVGVTEATISLTKQVKNFRDHVEENSCVTLSPAANTAIKNVAAPLAAYIASAEKIVATVATEHSDLRP